MRLIVVVEGQTEEAFINEVLTPHLQGHGIFAVATIVGTPIKRGSAPLQKGGGDWGRWLRDLQRISKEQKGNQVRITTMFDLYGLPHHFPGLKEHGSDTDTNRRCDNLQQALFEKLDDWRLIPYIQRHEFEALVLASLPALRTWFDDDEQLEGLDALEQEIEGLAPEDINDGRETAPSKRISNHIPGYRKTVHGPDAIHDTGLIEIREQCPRFDAWVAKLECLGKE